ncbi:HD-GYP domain-containing protein [Methylophaga lonarensis]|uniref:HD-GYP domain-containing protein n=1 Tax=Methylophaga lonarensis TaxID=999151 RepID=UPI003D29F128
MSDQIIKIPVSELKVGMYIIKTEGSWLASLFKKKNFLLTDPDDLEKIARGSILWVWIDLDKSLEEFHFEQPGGVLEDFTAEMELFDIRQDALLEEAARLPEDAPKAMPSLEAAIEISAAAETLAANNEQSAVTRLARVSLESEFERAKRICLEAKQQVTAMFDEVRMGRTVSPESTLTLIDEVTASIERHPAALISVARLKTHDTYTYLHSVAVCAMMASLARQLGMDDNHVKLAAQAGLFHDLGKAMVPDEIINKPGKLTDEEFEIVKQHPVNGAELLRQVDAPEEVVDVALHHHEKFDGTGYVYGLKGEQISVFARMGAICDVYDAVTSIRAYKTPWDPAAALQSMASWHGHFDPVIFKAFVKCVGIYPIGSLVRLESQRLAVVVDIGEQSLLTPKVRVFYSVRKREPVKLQTLDLGALGCNDQIIGLEDPADWPFGNLDDLWT